MPKQFNSALLRPRPTPRATVPEDLARKLEEAAEADGNGVAGARFAAPAPAAAPVVAPVSDAALADASAVSSVPAPPEPLPTASAPTQPPAPEAVAAPTPKIAPVAELSPQAPAHAPRERAQVAAEDGDNGTPLTQYGGEGERIQISAPEAAAEVGMGRPVEGPSAAEPAASSPPPAEVPSALNERVSEPVRAKRSGPRRAKAEAPPEPVGIPSRSGTKKAPRVRTDGQKMRATTIHIPIPLAKETQIFAVNTDQSMNAIMVAAIEEYLDRHAR